MPNQWAKLLKSDNTEYCFSVSSNQFANESLNFRNHCDKECSKPIYTEDGHIPPSQT